MFTRVDATTWMQFKFAPAPSSVPPAMETLCDPVGTWTRKAAVADEDEAATVVLGARTRHSFEPSTSPVELTEYVAAFRFSTRIAVGLAVRALLSAACAMAIEPDVSCNWM